MAAWMIGALSLLAGFVTRAGGARALARRAALPVGAGLAGAVIGAGGPGIPGIDLFPEGALAEVPKRRRRRRALTASDRADIAFIESILGKAAGKSFAMIIATRT